MASPGGYPYLSSAPSLPISPNRLQTVVEERNINHNHNQNDHSMTMPIINPQPSVNVNQNGESALSGTANESENARSRSVEITQEIPLSDTDNLMNADINSNYSCNDMFNGERIGSFGNMSDHLLWGNSGDSGGKGLGFYSVFGDVDGNGSLPQVNDEVVSTNQNDYNQHMVFGDNANNQQNLNEANTASRRRSDKEEMDVDEDSNVDETQQPQISNDDNTNDSEMDNEEEKQIIDTPSESHSNDDRLLATNNSNHNNHNENCNESMMDEDEDEEVDYDSDDPDFEIKRNWVMDVIGHNDSQRIIDFCDYLKFDDMDAIRYRLQHIDKRQGNLIFALVNINDNRLGGIICCDRHGFDFDFTIIYLPKFNQEMKWALDWTLRELYDYSVEKYDKETGDLIKPIEMDDFQQVIVRIDRKDIKLRHILEANDFEYDSTTHNYQKWLG